MASIQHRQRADGTVAYRVMFREHKGSGVVSETFDTADQAEYFKGLVERIGGAAARAKRAQAHHEGGPTMTEVLDHYLDVSPDITPGTGKEYRALLCRSGFDDVTGGIGVELIAREDVEAWVKHRSTTPTKRTKRPPAPKTVANEHGLISTLLDHAAQRGWRSGNPAKGVRLPKAHKPERAILTDMEFVALWGHHSDRYKPLVWLLAATGLRWGEATALQWRHIGRDTITVSQAWKHGGGSRRELGEPKTAKGYRRVETTPAVIASLGERGPDNAFVFTNAKGAPVNYQTFYADHWLPACKAANLLPRPKVHGLRHFAASHMLAQGADLFEVSRALGHSSVSITADVYGHLVPSKTRPTSVHAARLDALKPAQIES